MAGLAKLAISFDARRSKQYWQLLKRLHGGSDEAINYIRNTGDDGIWHGTRSDNAPGINQEGLKSAHGVYGQGVYMAPKEDAERYGATLYAPSTLYRLAKPSELRGTKELYPDVQSAGKFHPDGGRRFSPKSEIENFFHKRYQDMENAIKSHEDKQKWAVLDFNYRKSGAGRTVHPNLLSPDKLSEWQRKRVENGLANSSNEYARMIASDNSRKQLVYDALKKYVAPSNAHASELTPEMHKFRNYGTMPYGTKMNQMNQRMLMFANPANTATIPPSILRRDT